MGNDSSKFKHDPLTEQWQDSTISIHGGHQSNNAGSLVSPLYQSATFVFDNAQQGGARFAGDESGYIYTRLGNPTTNELEERVALLERAEAAAATASGMAAVSAALLSNLQQGDHLVASKAVYGCTFSLLTQQFSRFGIEVSLVDFTDKNQIIAAIKENTKVIYCETPVNPHLEVYDLSMINKIAKQFQLVSIVDNTFLTPLLQKPITHGIDLVVHSATKYLNGHGDVIAGMVCGTKEKIDKVKFEILKDIGAILSPHDAWLITRGLKTLDTRMQRHCDNAERVATMLCEHPKVKTVYYPGLKSHSGYKLMGRQMQRAGAVIAFELKTDFQQTIDFVNGLKLFSIAVSLGDAESLVQHPASMTHSTYTEEARVNANIPDSLIRISVGLEAVEDLILDIEQSFKLLD